MQFHMLLLILLFGFDCNWVWNWGLHWAVTIKTLSSNGTGNLEPHKMYFPLQWSLVFLYQLWTLFDIMLPMSLALNMIHWSSLHSFLNLTNQIPVSSAVFCYLVVHSFSKSLINIINNTGSSTESSAILLLIFCIFHQIIFWWK